MREKHWYAVISFHTTAEAMALERFCREQQIAGRLIPIPRELSAGCGMAWRMEPEEYRRAEKILAEMEYEQVAKLLL